MKLFGEQLLIVLKSKPSSVWFGRRFKPFDKDLSGVQIGDQVLVKSVSTLHDNRFGNYQKTSYEIGTIVSINKVCGSFEVVVSVAALSKDDNNLAFYKIGATHNYCSNEFGHFEQNIGAFDITEADLVKLNQIVAKNEKIEREKREQARKDAETQARMKRELEEQRKRDEEAARKAQEEAAAEMERARQELRNKPMDMTVGMYVDLLDEIKSLKKQIEEIKLELELND